MKSQTLHIKLSTSTSKSKEIKEEQAPLFNGSISFFLKYKHIELTWTQLMFRKKEDVYTYYMWMDLSIKVILSKL